MSCLRFLFGITFGADWELFCAKSCKVGGNVVIFLGGKGKGNMMKSK